MIAALDRRTILASALLAAAAGPAAAQEKITLRLAESLPAGHVIHELVAKPFMELVTKGTNGQVTFQEFPAEQLGKAKDMAQLPVAGVADVSYIVPSYSSDKYPLTAVAELLRHDREMRRRDRPPGSGRGREPRRGRRPTQMRRAGSLCDHHRLTIIG